MGCCGNDNKAALAAAQLVQRQGLEIMNNMPDMQAFNPNQGEVRMMFVGTNTGSIPYGGPGITPSGRTYRGADNIFDKYVNADPRDVAWLQGLGVWRVVPSAAAQLPPVPVLQVADEPLPTAPAVSVSERQLDMFKDLPEEPTPFMDAVKQAKPGDTIRVSSDGNATVENEVPEELLDIGPEPISEEQALKEIMQSVAKAPPGKGRRSR